MGETNMVAHSAVQNILRLKYNEISKRGKVMEIQCSLSMRVTTLLEISGIIVTLRQW